jgi:hypothetical protein
MEAMITYANNEWAWIKGDGISSCPTKSSAIEYWQYNVKTNALVVQYKGTNKEFYTYVGVPFSAVFALMSADSLGAFIAKEIKPNYGLVS